jgi:hypothetical protein
MSDEGVRQIGACKHLKYLELTRNANLTDRSGESIVEKPKEESIPLEDLLRRDDR